MTDVTSCCYLHEVEGVTMSGVAKCPEMDLNHRPIDFQSIALPLSYQDYNFIVVNIRY